MQSFLHCKAMAILANQQYATVYSIAYCLLCDMVSPARQYFILSCSDIAAGGQCTTGACAIQHSGGSYIFASQKRLDSSLGQVIISHFLIQGTLQFQGMSPTDRKANILNTWFVVKCYR